MTEPQVQSISVAPGLHTGTGEHRSTAPTADGSALGLYEARLKAHLSTPHVHCLLYDNGWYRVRDDGPRDLPFRIYTTHDDALIAGFASWENAKWAADEWRKAVEMVLHLGATIRDGETRMNLKGPVS